MITHPDGSRCDYRTEPQEDAATFSGADVLAAVAAAAPEAPAYVEQTGGGCATVYVGTPRRDADGDTRYAVVLGPGTYDWGDPHASTFYANDLYIGPDDDGDSDPMAAHTLADVTAAVRLVLDAQRVIVEDILPGTPEWDESDRALGYR